MMIRMQINLKLLVTIGLIALLTVMLLITVAPAFAAPPQGGTFVHTIQSSSDDATQSVPGGILDTSAAVLVLGDFDGLTSTVVGLRFINIEVPQGGTVSDAIVFLTASSGSWSGSTTIFVNGHDVGNSPTFGSGNGGPLDRVGELTSSGAAWAPVDWTGGTVYQSPDLSPILNEIFARPDWSSGNAVTLIIQDDGVVNGVRREAVSYDGEPLDAAQLNFFFAGSSDTPMDFPGDPDWVITDFSLGRNNDCDDSELDECGIAFRYQVADLNGDSQFVSDVMTNNVHIVDLSGQEFAPGPHPGGTGFIPYSEFPSLAYADVMACGLTGLFAIIDGGVHGEVNTDNNWAVEYLPALDEGTDVHFPSEPLISTYRPSRHDVFSVTLPLQYFLEVPTSIDTPCLPLDMLGDYLVQLTVFIEGQQVAQYEESPGTYYWHMFGFGNPRPHTGDDVVFELLLNSDSGVDEQDRSNNTCQINMAYQRRTANPFDIITHDMMRLVSANGCNVVFGIEGSGVSSDSEALTSVGADEDETDTSGQTIGIVVIIVVAFGGGLLGKRFAPAKWGTLLPTAAGAVVGAGIAVGIVVVISSMRTIAPPSDGTGDDGIASAPLDPNNLKGLLRQSDDEHPTYCGEFAHTYAEAITTAAGDEIDILIHIAVPTNVTLPPDSRFRITVKDNNGASRAIVTDETIVSLASAGLYPDSVSSPLVWQLRGTRLRAISPDGSVFFDDFLDPESGWIGGASAPGYGAYNSDGYRIITTIAKSVIWARPTLWLEDVRIEVDTEKGDGTDDNFFGVICRYQSSQNFYALIISSDGHYGIARRVDGGALELIGLAEMPFSDVINQGDESNRIMAECVGDVLRLTVNGQTLLEMPADDFMAGDVGIIVGTFDEPRTNILFDNFAVFEVVR